MTHSMRGCLIAALFPTHNVFCNICIEDKQLESVNHENCCGTAFYKVFFFALQEKTFLEVRLTVTDLENSLE